MDLTNFNLLSLQTQQMQKDPTTIALCSALQPLFSQLPEETKAVIIYARIDTLNDSLLDELAWQFHIDTYDAYAPIEAKRRLIKQSIQIHAYKGTVYAVRTALQATFGRAVVNEWFKYGGEAYHFRVDIDASETGIGEREIAYSERIALENKNVRSFLESIHIFLTTYAQHVVRIASVSGEATVIYPYALSDILLQVVARKQVFQKSAEKSIIYPKGE